MVSRDCRRYSFIRITWISTDLRSMTGGIGEYSYEFSRYEQAPSDVQQKVIEDNEKEENSESNKSN